MGRHRHERWLHTRISEDLEEALKREARRRRSPVSLVVRNVLEGALNLVEDIVEDSMEVARRSRRLMDVGRGRASSEKADLDEIYGWQEILLNRDAGCARCGAELASGAGAYRGLRDAPGGPPVFLCPDCVGALRRSNEDRKEEKRR